MRHGIFAACSASPSVSPPMPPPTMMMSSMVSVPAPRRAIWPVLTGSNRLVSLLSISGRALPCPHKAHAHARDLVDDLTCEALGAGPRAEARVLALARIAMRAPAVAIFGAGEFGC